MNLKDKCKARLMTRRQLAHEIGIDYPNFTRWLKGEIQLGKKSIQKIKDYLK